MIIFGTLGVYLSFKLRKRIGMWVFILGGGILNLITKFNDNKICVLCFVR